MTTSRTPTQVQIAAEVRAAILRRVTDEQFTELFSKLPQAAQDRITRQFSPQPVRVTVKGLRQK